MTDRRKIPAVASQDAPGTAIAGEGGATPRPRTTMLQRSLVLSLRKATPDASLRAIADAVGISESSVRRIIAYQTADVKATTEAVMQTAVLERLDDWAKASRIAAKKGYHQPAKDFLEAAKAIEPKPTGPSVTVAPTVVLNMPFSLGAVKPEPPAIDVQPIPQLPESKP